LATGTSSTTTTAVPQLYVIDFEVGEYQPNSECGKPARRRRFTPHVL
jgi:hypothetical protein